MQTGKEPEIRPFTRNDFRLFCRMCQSVEPRPLEENMIFVFLP